MCVWDVMSFAISYVHGRFGGWSIVSLVPTGQVEYRRPSGDWAMQGGEQDGEDTTMEEDGTNFCQMWSVTLYSLRTTPQNIPPESAGCPALHLVFCGKH